MARKWVLPDLVFKPPREPMFFFGLCGRKRMRWPAGWRGLLGCAVYLFVCAPFVSCFRIVADPPIMPPIRNCRNPIGHVFRATKYCTSCLVFNRPCRFDTRISVDVCLGCMSKSGCNAGRMSASQCCRLCLMLCPVWVKPEPKVEEPPVVIDISNDEDPVPVEAKVEFAEVAPMGKREQALQTLFVKYSQEVLRVLPKRNVGGEEAVAIVQAVQHIQGGAHRLMKAVRKAEARK